jgi:hypothetical protein
MGSRAYDRRLERIVVVQITNGVELYRIARETALLYRRDLAALNLFPDS